LKFRDLLKNGTVILDGGMGTMLQAKGMELDEIPELLGIKKADWIIDIHRQYVNAGADMIYMNTFGANSYKLSRTEFSVDDVIHAALANARKAAEGTDTLVALDIGPIGQLLEPAGTLTFEDAYSIFKEQVIAGRYADCIVIETMTDLCELKAAILAAKENSKLPVICTMSFEENQRTFTGCQVSALALTAEGLGVDAVGVNCSLGPAELYPVVEELMKWTSLPVIVKPNAGLPDPETNKFTITADAFAAAMKPYMDMGVQLFGGCCGTTPEFIKSMRRTFLKMDHTAQAPERTVRKSAVCSSLKTVCMDAPKVIGERINPTGKKRFKEALINNDIDYILHQAIEQVEAGADILDVNVGLPGIDETKMMVTVVKELQGVVDVPLQIDSTSPAVIEAALRVYNGKAIVNSVNGEAEVLDSILPIVKKYGAAVVGLTLDKNGIPKTAEERFHIAENILAASQKYGIAKEDVFIDCLTLTASAEQEGVMETLQALLLVRQKLGVQTVLGVSNISFGLPNRELVNQNFFMMALMQGLTLPILNPNSEAMMGTLRAYRLLTNIDKNAAEYISYYQNMTVQTMAGQSTANQTASAASAIEQKLSVQDETGRVTEKQKESISQKDNRDLSAAIEQGLKKEAAEYTEKLLQEMTSMQIVDQYLIPALDHVGARFEQGKVFLPQLILSAAAAQSAFEVIKRSLETNGTEKVNKGTIVLATVHGDVHDIGKNIVKVLLENYGYTIIDLGKNVPKEDIVSAAIEHNASLVGLSALMTTTLPSMEAAIMLLREKKADCRVMVGGAVLTKEYALKIGADYYCKDAKEAVDTAKLVYKN